MPSDSNGVYSLPTGYLAVTGEVIQASQHNPPLEDLASAMSARLMRSGAAPMTGPIKVVDGSVGSPAVQLANASSTGFYKTTNGLGVSIGGTKVAEFGPGGLVSGGHFIGELIPYTGTTAPALTVLPYGQTLNRADYPDLWAFAQTEIAAANTLYNNGNGTTTFGIPDMRGRVPAGADNMGGGAANRLPGFTLWVVGGAATHTLSAAEHAPHTHSGTTGDDTPDHAHTLGYIVGTGTITASNYAAGTIPGGAVANPVTGGASSRHAHPFTTNTGNGVAGNPHNNVQPTVAINFILFAGA